MKKYITLLGLALVTNLSIAQKTINASDILKDIKAGKDVNISNTTIEGTLDFTFMDEKLENLPKKKRKSWWNNTKGNNTIKNLIESKVVFTNCTFTSDVLAYIPDGDYSGYTFIANFEEDAIFKNCTFKRKAMFKYSYFEKNTSFEGASFEDDTTFKYAKFDNFVSFANTNFIEEATFKYSHFYQGVSFKNANFEEDLNIKYTKVKGSFNITGMKVAYDIDSKYTKINGQSFSKYMIEKQ